MSNSFGTCCECGQEEEELNTKEQCHECEQEIQVQAEELTEQLGEVK